MITKEPFSGFDNFDTFFDVSGKSRLFPEVGNEPVSPMGSYFKGDGESYVLKVGTCNLIDYRHVSVEFEENNNCITIKVRYSYKNEVEPYTDYTHVDFDWFITRPLPKDADPDTLTANVGKGVVTVVVKKRTTLCNADEEHTTPIKIKRLKS